MFAGLLNAALNMILVIVFHLGVAGAAIATVFSQMISCVLVLRCLIKSKESYRLDLKQLHINPAILKRIFAIGIPAAIQSTVISFSNVLLQSSVNSFGSIAMAGYTAANNLLGFLYMSVNAISQACMSFTSQNYAVKNMGRVKKVIGRCLLLEVIVAATLGILVHIFGSQLLGIYNSSPEVIEAGRMILHYTTLTYFICGFMDCLPGALRGLGRSTVPMILSVVGTVGTRIVWIYGLFPSHRSLNFLFISYPASWLLTFLMQAVCLCLVIRKIEKKTTPI
jgi:putative MATE family efflux protein